MKKILLLTLSTFCVLTGFTQVSLTSDFTPLVGEIFLNFTDTLPNASVTNGNAGTSETYAVEDFDTDITEELKFVDPTTQANSADFPTANLSIDVGFGIGFLETSSAGIELIGLTIENPLDGSQNTLKLTNSESFAVYPSTYGSSYTDDAYGRTSFYVGQDVGGFQIDSARVTYESETEVSYDGLGTISNGTRTFPALRERKYQILTVTIEVCTQIPFFGCQYQDLGSLTGEPTEPDTTVTYSYYTDAFTTKLPVAALTYNADETVLQEVVLNAQDDLFSGISERLKLPIVKAYPNPTTSEFEIETESPVVAGQIINTSGKVLMNIKSNHVNISSLATGVYLIIGTTDNGALFQATVQKY